MRWNQATAIKFFNYCIPYCIFFLCRTSSPSFSSLRSTFLLIPSWGNTATTTEQGLINTCADWGVKWSLCPELATSHILALPCTFKKLYLKTEQFHLPLFIQVLLWLRRISPFLWCTSVDEALFTLDNRKHVATTHAKTDYENNEWILYRVMTNVGCMAALNH